ncbi:MAG TPA: TerB family tellurite resistance protein [Burkholderiales bacterium]|nr:TerB family tellurite resistance protein [Burkholderiales bacterium]
MLKALKSLFDDAGSRPLPGHERRHLHVAVASLLHEASRVDLREDGTEHAAAQAGLADLFGLTEQEAAAVLAEGRGKARQMTSYFGAVAVVKRDMGQPERVRLIEHLWRIAYADGPLDPYEDHYVRKIGHLLYVTNTDIVLARNRARTGA